MGSSISKTLPSGSATSTPTPLKVQSPGQNSDMDSKEGQWKMDQGKEDVEQQALERTLPTTFLDLPAELRNQIYDMVLVSEETTIVELTRGILVRRQSIDLQSEVMVFTPGLLRVSRQIHLETAPVLYGANAFSLSSRYEMTETSTTAEVWTRSIGQNIKYLRVASIEQEYWFVNHGAMRSLQTAIARLAAAPDLLMLRLCLPRRRRLWSGGDIDRRAEEDKCRHFRDEVIRSLYLLPVQALNDPDETLYNHNIFAVLKNYDYVMCIKKGRTLDLRRLLQSWKDKTDQERVKRSLAGYHFV